MSASALDALLPLLESGNVQQVSRQLGIGEDQASTAIKAAVPLLVGALQREASSPAGLDSLAGALDRDHDGSVLDDIGAFLGGGGNATAGAGILGHVLGSRQSNVAASLGQSTGLDAGSVLQLLTILAPLVMGALGKAKRQTHADAGGLADILGGATRQVDQQAPDLMSSLGRMLDTDGDGSAIDDVAKIAGSLFGSRR
jgi:hypothetical protein